jgi:hypothetical protein
MKGAPMTRRWWVSSRSPVPVDRFRAVTGLSVAAYVAASLWGTAPLIAGAGSYDPAPLRATLWNRTSFLAAGESTAYVQAVFALAIGLALCAAAGILARLCAGALLLIAAGTAWALLPVARVDDAAMCAASFALVVLPSGRSLFGGSGTAPARSVPGHGVTAVLVATLLLYVGAPAGLLPGLDGARIGLAFPVIAVAFIAPSTALLAIALAAQAALHLYLACTTHAPLTHVLLAATGLLFWGERPARESVGASSRPAPQGGVDAGAVVAFGAIACVLAACVRLPGLPWVAPRARRLLADTGVLAFEAGGTGGTTEGPAGVSIRGASEGFAAPIAFPDAARADALVAVLTVSPPPPMAIAVASSAARRYCGEHAGRGDMRTLSVLGPYGDRPVLRFRCAPDGTTTDVETPD